jgi:hypothetical protein
MVQSYEETEKLRQNGNSGDRREQLEGNGGTVKRDKRPGRCADVRPERAKWDMRDQGDCVADETNERSGLGNVLTGKIGKGRSLSPFFCAILGGSSVVGSAVVLDFRGDLRTWGSSSTSDSSAVSGLSDTTAFAFMLRGAGVAAVGSREGVSGGGGGALCGGHNIGVRNSEGVSGRGEGALREGTILWR